MTCVCGGTLIPGPFGPGVAEADRDAQFPPALEQFLTRAGASTELTMQAWADARDRLAIDIALVQLLEQGQIECTGTTATNEPLFVRKEPGRRAGVAQ